jgi:CheY-like chemotaxis protein
MRDIVFYLGTDSQDFSIISATFHQFARLVELHFITAPDDLFARIDELSRRPSLIFMSLLPHYPPAPDLLRHVKSRSARGWIPVILIGATDDQWSQDEMISAGAARFLRNPLQPDALQRLFSAAGELLIRPQEDAPVLVASSQSVD